MNLQKKTILIIFLTFISFSSLVFVMGKGILGKSFVKLEEEYAGKGMVNAKSALGISLENLDKAILDWSSWDDTYEFIGKPNEDYIESNLGDSSFEQLNLNNITFINSTGNIVFAKEYDLQKRKMLEINQEKKSILLSEKVISNFSNVNYKLNGIFMTSKGPVMIAARPILHSDGSGPSRGMLIMCRDLDQIEIERLSHVTNLPVVIRKINDSNLSTGLKIATEELKQGKDVFIQSEDKDNVAAYTFIKDINDKPILVMKVNSERSIYKSSARSFKFFSFSLWASMLGISIALLWGLRYAVLSPLRALTQSMKKIGDSRDLSIRLSVNSKDEIGVLASTANDMLEELESTQQKLQESEQKYRHLFESMVEGFALCRIESNVNGFTSCIFIEANIAFEEMVGIKREEIIGNTAENMEFKFSASGISWENIYDRTIRNKEKLEAEFHSSKNEKHYLVSIYSPEENYLITLFRDITELKEAEAKLILAKDAAESASETKGIFLANMSHEIRTPMNAIIGMTELLMDSPLNERQREYVTSVQNAGNLLLGIINDILDFSKVEAGKMILNETKFSMTTIVENVAEIMAVKARGKKLSFMTYISPEIPLLRGDSDRLCQVLLNLVGNAIKFTHEGEVIVRASLHKASSKHAEIKIEVVDTGIGIPQETLKNLFQPFVQGDGSTTRKYGGTGLGLSISKGIIELMKGNIKVESEPGKGTKFSFLVKLETLENTKKSREYRNFQDVRTLIISQSASTEEILTNYLCAWGASKDSVAFIHDHSRNELCIDNIISKPWDLVVVDICREIDLKYSEIARAVNCPSLLIDALNIENSGERALESGFSAYLSKPVKQSQLYDCIITLLNRESTNQDKPVGEYSSGLDETAVTLNRNRSTQRVLLAEDNIINRKLALLQLEKLGVCVEAVENGKQAVERISKERYDMVMMDCQMPEMDGFEATKAIRKLEATLGYNVVIVAMTANAMEGDRERCLAAGMNDYMSKPVRIQNLINIFEKWKIDFKNESG